MFDDKWRSAVTTTQQCSHTRAEINVFSTVRTFTRNPVCMHNDGVFAEEEATMSSSRLKTLHWIDTKSEPGQGCSSLSSKSPNLQTAHRAAAISKGGRRAVRLGVKVRRERTKIIKCNEEPLWGAWEWAAAAATADVAKCVGAFPWEQRGRWARKEKKKKKKKRTLSGFKCSPEMQTAELASRWLSLCKRKILLQTDRVASLSHTRTHTYAHAHTHTQREVHSLWQSTSSRRAKMRDLSSAALLIFIKKRRIKRHKKKKSQLHAVP